LELALTPRSLGEQLAAIHERIREELPRVERIGVALYDPKTGLIKSFIHSAEGPGPLTRFEVRLSETPSILALARSGEPGVLTDLAFLAGPAADPTRRLLEQGVRSSFTKPFFSGRRLLGFLIFDSATPGYFDAVVANRLDLYAQILSLLFLNGLEPARLLRSAVRLAAEFTHLRDGETGAHLERVTRYACLIARALPPAYGVDEEFVEFLGFFAPAHDIGKVGIPDQILGKRGPFTPEEAALMRTHVESGVTLVEKMIGDLDLDGHSHVSMLRSIVRSHHEALDGSGYPDGLTAAQIPLEARIVAVADVFDALTSSRPYKEAWSENDAFRYLEEGMGKKFDPACVTAFLSRSGETVSIRRLCPDGA
jgi:two-component system response regulator RpfG